MLPSLSPFWRVADGRPGRLSRAAPLPCTVCVIRRRPPERLADCVVRVAPQAAKLTGQRLLLALCDREPLPSNSDEFYVQVGV